MRILAPVFCLALTLLVVSHRAVAKQCPLMLAGEGEEKTGCYTVVLKPATSHERMMDIIDSVKQIKGAEDSKMYGVVEEVIKAFTVKLSQDSLSTVSCTFSPLLSPLSPLLFPPLSLFLSLPSPSPSPSPSSSPFSLH